MSSAECLPSNYVHLQQLLKACLVTIIFSLFCSSARQVREYYFLPFFTFLVTNVSNSYFFRLPGDQCVQPFAGHPTRWSSHLLLTMKSHHCFYPQIMSNRPDHTIINLHFPFCLQGVITLVTLSTFPHTIDCLLWTVRSCTVDSNHTRNVRSSALCHNQQCSAKTAGRFES